MNYFQIVKILLYLSHSEEDLRIFEFTPKVSPLFSPVFDVQVSRVLQEERAALKKKQQKQACFLLKSQVNVALALLSAFYPGALGMRELSQGPLLFSVLRSQKTFKSEIQGSSCLEANWIHFCKLLYKLSHTFNRIILEFCII